MYIHILNILSFRFLFWELIEKCVYLQEPKVFQRDRIDVKSYPFFFIQPDNFPTFYKKLIR